MTTKASFRLFCSKLTDLYSDREAQHIANMVFEQVTGYTRLDLITRADTTIPAGRQKELDKKLRLLLNEIPVQYVLGEAWFYKWRFHVNEHVLIPRPETEELVAWITEDVATGHAFPGHTPPRTFTILDMGTGSGCIAIALKKNLPAASLIAIDKSGQALDIARKNAAMHRVAVNFIQTDILDPGSYAGLPSVDLIAGNPPYIPSQEKKEMQPRVVNHEPSLALFVPDHDPLLFYRAILEMAGQKLAAHGMIYTEIHENFGAEVRDLFRQYGLENVTLRQDINGRDRMVRGTKGCI